MFDIVTLLYCVAARPASVVRPLLVDDQTLLSSWTDFTCGGEQAEFQRSSVRPSHGGQTAWRHSTSRRHSVDELGRRSISSASPGDGV